MSTRASRQITNEDRIRDLQRKNRKNLIDSLKVVGVGGQSLRSIGNSGSESNGTVFSSTNANLGKITFLGTLTDPFAIDFSIYDEHNLIGNIDKNTTITFANIPPTLRLHLKLYILSADPTIIIGGINVKTTFPALHPLAIGDFLDFDLESDDQATVSISVLKKNNEIDTGGPQAPSFVGNIETSLHTETSFTVSWDAPKTGDTPITYDVEYSLSPAETAGVPNTPITDPSTKDLTGTSVSITGLVAGEAYYVWVKAKNAIGDSGFNGPVQTNTDGTQNAGAVNFTLTPKVGTFDIITASWDQPAGKQLKFSLLREADVGQFVILVRDEVPPAGTTFTYDDDDFLDPNTAYNYRLEIRNEFNQLIGTINASATTNTLPAPTVVFAANGARLKFTVTLPIGIGFGTVQWSLDNTVDANGAFTHASTKTQDIVRPVGSSQSVAVDVDFFTPVLTPSTLYYGHAKLRKGAGDGPYSATASAITGSVLPPPQPLLNVTSPAVGQVRINVKFNGSINTGEEVAVSYRLSSSVGEYTGLETLKRDDPPADDLDTREDRIEVIRSGFTSGQQLTFRAEAFNVGGASAAGPDFDTVLID